MIVVDPQSGVPVYRQLMDQIKLHIAGGLLKPGDELPSTRSLSSELGVNPMTISKAYSYLEKEEVIERRPGRPLVVRHFETGQIRRRKIDQLRQSLEPTITMIRQLGIADEDAVQLFTMMLDRRPFKTAPDNLEEDTDDNSDV
jgi:GntR family transcriptional regulator